MPEERMTSTPPESSGIALRVPLPTLHLTPNPSTSNPYLEEVGKWVRLRFEDWIRDWDVNSERHFENEIEAYRERPKYVDRYSWAVPNEDALNMLARYSPLVEIGAGNGYWAHLLRERGVDIVAYDLLPPNEGANTFHSGARVWTEVLKGSHEKVRRHRDRTLFLCWPPYANPMARKALARFRGDTVIYVGEWMACTADDQFHELLEAKFEQVERVEIPSWPGIRDSLTVWRRK